MCGPLKVTKPILTVFAHLMSFLLKDEIGLGLKNVGGFLKDQFISSYTEYDFQISRIKMESLKETLAVFLFASHSLIKYSL